MYPLTCQMNTKTFSSAYFVEIDEIFFKGHSLRLLNINYRHLSWSGKLYLHKKPRQAVVNQLSFRCRFLHPKLLVTCWRQSLPISLAQEDHPLSHGSPNTVSPAGSVVFTHIHTPAHTIFPRDMVTTEYLPGGWQHIMCTLPTAHFNHARWVPFTHFSAKELRPYEMEQLAQDWLARSGA